MIYFLRAEQTSYNKRTGNTIEVGYVKIGTTVRLSQRLKQIATNIGHTPTVLGVLDGGYAEEAALHERYKGFRRGGEWFDPEHSNLLTLIDDEARPWDGVDEKPDCLAVQIRGSEEWRAWVDRAARFNGTNVTSMFDMAVARFVRESGFNEVPPER